MPTLLSTFCLAPVSLSFYLKMAIKPFITIYEHVMVSEGALSLQYQARLDLPSEHPGHVGSVSAYFFSAH